MSHKELPKLFSIKGFNYKQIHRDYEWAIYERHRIGSDHPHYEVIRIRKHNGYSVGDGHIEPSEYYPSSEEWGTYGFTFSDKQDAFDKFDRLLG